LLSTQSQRSNGDLTYLTITIAAAHLRLGDLAEAHALLQSQWSSLNHSARYQLPLLQLLALSQGPRNANVALARP
jgi:hypothetical protein